MAVLFLIMTSDILLPARADLSLEEHTLVIDAGHGGIDGGAISKSGLKESDLNLTIALKTEALADFTGLKVYLTRREDTDFSDGAYSEHDNLLKRAELCEAVDRAVLLSIHQNTFPDPRVRGAEVMYAQSSGSELFAKTMQELLVTWLDPSNRRVASPAPKSLLLTSSVSCPAVLVECGFLSNEKEAEALAEDEYQKKIAMIFIASYIDFLHSEKKI